MSISWYGMDAQYGIGANGKNLNNGLAAWFSWEWNKEGVKVQSPNNKTCFVNKNNGGGHGDINIDIAPPACAYGELIWVFACQVSRNVLTRSSFSLSGRRVRGQNLHGQILYDVFA